ncbi:Protein of unknown function [Cotesia congregata]|uniref:Uncharacterized protein n=1 Tax=Cotesia congregata TaxID=51543 RepID=A0A8J2MDQ7_COTCN|nr:Protein of unknown function [Cotesia congregata]
MPNGKEANQAGSSNWFQGNFKLGRSISVGELKEWNLEKDKEDRELIKKSKLQLKTINKGKELNAEEMETLMKKLEDLDERIKQECKKVSDEVGVLRMEGKKEREEMKKIWEAEKKIKKEKIKGIKDRLDKLEQERVMVEKVEDGGGERPGKVMDAERRLRKLEWGGREKGKRVKEKECNS